PITRDDESRTVAPGQPPSDHARSHLVGSASSSGFVVRLVASWHETTACRATKLANELPHSKMLLHNHPDVSQRSDLSVPVEMIVCRYGNPGAVAARPVIGVTAPALLAVGRAGVEAPMDDREITQQADSHVLGHEPADRHRLRRQLEKLGLVEQRAVRNRAHEVVGQNLLEKLHITLLHRREKAEVQRGRLIENALRIRVRLHGYLLRSSAFSSSVTK